MTFPPSDSNMTFNSFAIPDLTTTLTCDETLSYMNTNFTCYIQPMIQGEPVYALPPPYSYGGGLFGSAIPIFGGNSFLVICLIFLF